jgi:hypothetical protein
MCNGYKHYPECDCGFGPPYPGRISIVEVTGWIEELAQDPTALPRRLGQMGLTPSDAARLRTDYAEAWRVVDSHESLLQRVQRVFQGISFETEDSETLVIDVPLFRLHSPTVKGARVAYAEGREIADGASWRVKLLGLGPGPSTTLQVGFTKGFESWDGQCREIFVPIAVELEHVRVSKRGRPAGRGLRFQVKRALEPKTLRTRGSRTLTSAQCAARHVPGACEEDTFLLAGDGGPEPATGDFHSSKDVAHEVGLSLTAFGVGIDALAQVRTTTHVRLTYSLPPGHNYVALREPRGVYWKLDDGTNAGGAAAS